MSDNRYDILHGPEGVSIEPHFCRNMDCFGTDPTHGFTWEEAKREVVEWHLEQARMWLYQEEEHYFLFPEE